MLSFPSPLLTDCKQSATVSWSMPRSRGRVSGGCSCQWCSFALKDLLRVSELGGGLPANPPPSPSARHFPRAALCWRPSGCQTNRLGAAFNFHLSHWCKLIACAEGPVGSADPLTSAAPGMLLAAWGAITTQRPRLPCTHLLLATETCAGGEGGRALLCCNSGHRTRQRSFPSLAPPVDAKHLMTAL